MRSKGKPSCGGWGCDPCNANTNPCFKMVTDGPVATVIDETPTDYTVEATESFNPEDLPRDSHYRCLWNPATSQYDCNYYTPGATDTEYSNTLTIQDRYGDDVLYRSVNYSTAANNLCEGQRWYGGAANQFPTSFNGSTFSTPADCKYDESGGTAGYCNWGVLPGHVGDMSTGPWTPTASVFFKWQRVTVGGVKKVRITVYGGTHHGWWGETDFYRAGSTPTAPVFWWPIPSGSPIRLAWTPTIQDDNSEPITSPGSIAESEVFQPWPDLLLTSCGNTFPTDCDPSTCLPECVFQDCGGVQRRRPVNLTVSGCPDLAALAPDTLQVTEDGFDSLPFGYGPTSPPGEPPVAMVRIQYQCQIFIDGGGLSIVAFTRRVTVTDTDAAEYILTEPVDLPLCSPDGAFHDTFTLDLIDCGVTTFDVFSDPTDPWEYL